MIIVTSSRKVINFDNVLEIRIGKIESDILLPNTKDTPELEVEYSNKFHELQSQGYVMVDSDKEGFTKMLKEISRLECVTIGDMHYIITLKEDSVEECVGEYAKNNK